MSTQVWLSLGSNIGDRKAQLSFAVEQLSAHPQIEMGRKSSIYQTAPWGVTEQDDFYNAVVEIFTDLSPWQLLKVTQRIEAAAGRQRVVHWGARELDIDMLMYGEAVIETGELQVPHQYIKERLFFLLPLQEIVGDMEIPYKGNLALIINALSETQRVEKVFGADQW